MNITSYGFDPDFYAPEGIPQGLTAARITASHRERYEIVSDFGASGAILKTKEYYVEGELFPTTGDFVLIDYNPSGESRIVRTLPRRTLFSRLDSFAGREQAVAANFDCVFVMQSLNHDFNPRRLERYLTMAYQSGAETAVLLTKSDLCPDPSPMLEMARGTVGSSKCRIITVSAVTREGFGELETFLAPGRTFALLGSSGVGKSSLVNAVAGREIMDTSGIREDDSKGRHTTTCRQLVMLDSGVMLIDTPGMRELGMWEAPQGLGETFPDVARYLGRCRFSDCTHGNEPGCAIREALESGELEPRRWESYKKLNGESARAESKAEYLRKKNDKFKGLSKLNKEKEKNKYKW